LAVNDFAITHARSTDPETSHKAAGAARALAQQHQQMILRAMSDVSGGMTISDLAALTGLDKHAVARRMPELERDGCVYWSGERPMPTGRKGRVWFKGSQKAEAAMPALTKDGSVQHEPFPDLFRSMAQ